MEYNLLVRLFLLSLAILLLLLPAQEGLAGNLGSNLGGVNYYDGQVVFSDLVRQGGEWLEGNDFPQDSRGWPKKVTEPLRMALAELQYPRGRYLVSWQGRGEFLVGGKRFSGREGSGEVFLDGSSLVLLEILRSQPDNYLRNIRVFLPGQGALRAGYLRSLRPYRALRFMDWQKTNGTFADPLPRLSCQDALAGDYISQGRRRGVSVVWMVRLANKLRANPWFTVPHRADNSWLRCHARYVNKHLGKGLLPRYEFSNETWNPAFEQFHDLRRAGLDAGLGSGDGFLAAQLESARRHIGVVKTVRQEISRPWRSVLAGQAANSWVLEQRLSLASAWTDEIAIAPYMSLPRADLYSPGDADFWAGQSVGEIVANLRLSLEEEVRPAIEDHLRLRKPLVAYEGGQHLVGLSENDALTEKLVAANRSAGIGELYRQYLRLWREETEDRLFVHYLDSGPHTRYGSWGAVESPGGSSPKLEALLDFRFGS